MAKRPSPMLLTPPPPTHQGRRPYTSVVCAGIEEGVKTMHRGGIRELIVPPALAFGAEGKLVAVGVSVPPGATLTYVVSLEDVSPSYL